MAKRKSDKQYVKTGKPVKKQIEVKSVRVPMTGGGNSDEWNRRADDAAFQRAGRGATTR